MSTEVDDLLPPRDRQHRGGYLTIQGEGRAVWKALAIRTSEDITAALVAVKAVASRIAAQK